MKQTAVEFYRINLMALVSTGKTDFKTEPEIFEQAKEMEKQQFIDTSRDVDNTDFWVKYESFEQYYNEKFKNK